MSPADQASMRASRYTMAQVKLQGLTDESKYWDCGFCWLNIVLKPDCSKYQNTYSKDSKCVCKDGYVVYNNECVSYYDYCYANYGNNTFGNKDEVGMYCGCVDGYEWSSDQTSCILRQKVLGVKIDKTLSKRLTGKLLLQVEQGGAIWYVDTKEFKRYSITWANALPLFRKLSLGITDADLAKIPITGSNSTGSTSMRNRLKGKLLLQVEQGGAIWYVDQDGYRHSVTWDNLMDLFRKLALGITNADLNKVEVGSLN